MSYEIITVHATDHVPARMRRLSLLNKVIDFIKSIAYHRLTLSNRAFQSSSCSRSQRGSTPTCQVGRTANGICGTPSTTCR